MVYPTGLPTEHDFSFGVFSGTAAGDHLQLCADNLKCAGRCSVSLLHTAQCTTRMLFWLPKRRYRPPHVCYPARLEPSVKI